jgi:membrane-associated protein
VTGLAVPVNLISGGGGLTFRRFFLYDLTGEAIWIFGYGGLGYLFGTQWEAVSDFLNNMSGFLLGVVILAIGVWLAFTLWKRNEGSKQQVPDV